MRGPVGGGMWVGLLILGSALTWGETPEISGRYPHLAMFNHGDECGIGAVVPWAGHLWAVTYSPHKPHGSDDKLYRIDERLAIEAFAGSIGGTPANRMVHRESEQLFIGPYVIDSQGQIRVIPYQRAVGRPTATARHLTDPAGKVYLFTMEEGLYEIDVRSLDVNTLQPDGHVEGFQDLLPGYHGKGAFTAQGRLVVANNGAREGPFTLMYDRSGCLAQWDGRGWQVLNENQFCEVTGPGGISGNTGDDDRLWATGWDKRSVILMLLDDGTWSTYRLPIGDYSYVAKHGWFTEWPRIREVVPAVGDAPARWLMNMHGLWFDFPPGLRRGNTDGLRPIASHLKISADFCHWRDRIVFACDDTAITGGNHFVNQSQSNLWFTTWNGLGHCGQPAGWGGPWLRDDVAADQPSDPFLLAGFRQRVLHLSHASRHAVTFTLEVGSDDGWRVLERIEVPPDGYRYVLLNDAPNEAWIRLTADREAAQATAYFHYGPGGGRHEDPSRFASLSSVPSAGAATLGIVRPRGGDLGTLQFLAQRVAMPDGSGEPLYYELGEDLKLRRVDNDPEAVHFLQRTAGLGPADFSLDQASVIVTEGDRRFRLPRSHAAYDQPWMTAWPRGKREVVTERRLFNCHGTFYVLPHDSAGGIAGIKPVCTHGKRISDFCSWRGLLVLTGIAADAPPDTHTIVAEDQQAALWLGDVDDLWRLGKPVGVGGPWQDTPVQPDEPSDPYLMTGYDRKRMELSHDNAQEVTFTVEVDFLRDGTWHVYGSFSVPSGETCHHEFPAGYSAHWVRLRVDRVCRATGQFTYE